MQTKKVSGVMTHRVIEAIGPDESVLQAATKMKEVKKGCLLVTEGAEPVGIVTQTDLINKVLAEGLSPAALSVSEVMTKELVTIDSESSVYDAVERMIEKRVRRLVVTEGDLAVGIVTTTDLAGLLVK